MVNAIRGEAALVFGGTRYTLLLTLGALAEIEEGLGLENISDIGPRLKKARAGDVAVIASALLKGGGQPMTPQEVLALPCEIGILMAAIAAAFERAGLKGEGSVSGPFAGAILSPSG